jgi:hypothetical protein
MTWAVPDAGLEVSVPALMLYRNSEIWCIIRRMYLYALYHSKPLPNNLVLPADQGSFRVDDRLYLFDSSRSFESVRRLVREHSPAGSMCPLLLLPISKEHYLDVPEASIWMSEHSTAS